jgi:hypothetical protein
MSEIQAVTATLISLKTASDMVKAFLDVRGAVQEQGKIFELQRVILAAHQSALDAQEAQSALLKRIYDLEQKIADFETWDSEKERYGLIKVGDASVFAYALKDEAKGTEPFHLLCAKCYQHRKKSILQDTPISIVASKPRSTFCPECKTTFSFCGVSEPPPTKGTHEFEYDPFKDA